MDNYKMKNEFVATNPCKPIDYSTLAMGGKDTFIKPQDPALISGADALAGITNIQHAYDDRDVWYTTQYSTLTIPEILKGETSDGRKINFRLKPPTISVNAELPKPSRELQQNTEVYAVTYEFKTREERNAFADKLRGTNS